MAAYYIFDSIFENSNTFSKKEIKAGLKRHSTWNLYMQIDSLHGYVKEILPLNVNPHLDLIEDSLALVRAQNLEERFVVQVKEVKKLWEESKYASREPKLLNWLWKGHQGTATGKFSIKKSEAVRDFIDHHHAEWISFNKNLTTKTLKGGSCTAMSMGLAASYLKKRVYLPLGAQIEEFRNCMRFIRADYEQPSREMRSRQAAFNTIEVTRGLEEIDYSLNKIKSLANYHHLEIDYASEEFFINKTAFNEFQMIMNALPEGVYILRLIAPIDNEKLEKHGHTLVYVKEPNIGFFYDPNWGVKDLYKKEHAEIIWEALKQNYRSFQVTHSRFYRVHSSSYQDEAINTHKKRKLNK